VPELLEDLQKALFQRAVEYRDSHTYKASTYDELKEGIERGGFVDAFWCEDAACEEKIKNDTKATNRCMPINQPGDSGVCIVCGKPSNTHALFAKAY
jgi:prolyl-tRNA synthetase